MLIDTLCKVRFLSATVESKKHDKKLADEAASIVVPLADAVDRATERLIVISPYFVPRKAGIEYFRELRKRGLEVVVVTNSLAANNHTIVHSGYAPSRKALLEMGVQIFEVRATAGIEALARAGARFAAPLRDPVVRVQRHHLLRSGGGSLRGHAGLQRGEGG